MFPRITDNYEPLRSSKLLKRISEGNYIPTKGNLSQTIVINFPLHDIQFVNKIKNNTRKTS